MNSNTTPSDPALSSRDRGLNRAASAPSPGLIQAGSLLAATVISLLTLSSTTGQRYALGLALLGIFFVTLMRAPETSLLLMLTFLALIGGVRRWLIPFLDYVPNDPFLLIVPLVLFLYMSVQFVQRRIKLNTLLSRRISWLLALMALQMANPLQGGPLVGIAGALFYIVPVLWYYIGRQVGTPSMLQRLLTAAIVIAVAGMLYGFKQTWFGMAASEEEWLRLTKFNQTLSNGQMRTLSFFTNGGEYSLFLGIATSVLWAAFLRGYRLAFVPIFPFVFAIFLGSYRSAVVATLLACTIIWTVQGRTYRSWLPRSVIALLVAVVGLTWSLQQVAKVSFDPNAQAAMQHQVNGLLNDSNAAAGSHVSLFSNGILSSFRAPFGRGLGATTLAGSKFGDTGTGTEFDISDMFVSLGVAGGVLYVVIVVQVLRTAFRYWMQTRSTVALSIIGILFLFLGHWLQAGYSGSIVLWFSIGVLDRDSLALEQKQNKPAIKGVQSGQAPPQEKLA